MFANFPGMTYADHSEAYALGKAAAWLWLAFESAMDGDDERASYRLHQSNFWRRTARNSAARFGSYGSYDPRRCAPPKVH